MNHRELMIALADLEPIRLTGRFERHSSLRWEQGSELRGSSAGGRWGAPRAYEVLYLGRPPASVVAEAYRHLVDDELDHPDLAAQVLERRIVACEVDVPGVIDLRPSAARERLGLTPEIMSSDVGDYDLCQRVGAGAHQLQASGVIAPSASGLGETLALFTLNLPADNWPRILERGIWNGLPPDPRHLQVADEESS